MMDLTADLGRVSVDLGATPGRGLFELEHQPGQFRFRWTKPTFELPSPTGYRYASLLVGVPPARTATILTTPLAQIDLPVGWHTIDVELPAGPNTSFAVTPPYSPGPEDPRELGIMLREVMFHNDPKRHSRLMARHDNFVLNTTEYRAGAVVLSSVPVDVRITTSHTCNIANETPCVYCAWDTTKRMEVGAPQQTAEFLDQMGAYFDLPLSVTDCSYGELPMERHFPEVVQRATRESRTFEFTSNGQTLGPRVRAKVLGQSVRLHVSIDSANAAGYRRYRDHRFDSIIANLRALCAERKATADLPEVFVSFIVMRSNRDEIPAFLALMGAVGVDRVTFRDLYREPATEGLRASHYGYNFDYEAERLTVAELDEIGQSCLTKGAEIGLPVALEWQAFSDSVAPIEDDGPICSEPWRTAYILNRGIMPCCYGREPIVGWDSITAAPTIEDGIRQALNSEPMQELRRDLANGRLGRYCEHAQSCPIVKRRSTATTVATKSSSRAHV